MDECRERRNQEERTHLIVFPHVEQEQVQASEVVSVVAPPLGGNLVVDVGKEDVLGQVLLVLPRILEVLSLDHLGPNVVRVSAESKEASQCRAEEGAHILAAPGPLHHALVLAAKGDQLAGSRG